MTFDARPAFQRSRNFRSSLTRRAGRAAEPDATAPRGSPPMSVDDDVKGGEGGGGGGGGESHRPSSAETVAVVVGAAAAPSPAAADDGVPATERTCSQQNVVEQDDRVAESRQAPGKEVLLTAAARPAVKTERQETGKEVQQPQAVKTETAKDVKTEAEKAAQTVRLLGEPLTSHGPYEFYGALAYRHDQEDAALKNKTRRRWKKRRSAAEEGGDPAATSSCDEDDEDGGQWSVVRMNHFYAVRPWYSKSRGCAADRKQMREQQQQQRTRGHDGGSPGSRAAAKERREQSVCIGELELLWRDDTVRPASKSVAATAAAAAAAAKTTASSDDEAKAAAAAAEEDPSAPRRRMLPRRTRQPSAKKIEAAESAAAAAAADSHASYQASYYRRKLQQQSAAPPPPPPPPRPAAPWGDYEHGNLLCSVRLYVMPDQTAAGRLSGVHGDDEVLEINTLGANGGGGDGGNAFVNGGAGTAAYNGGGGSAGDEGGGASPSSTGCFGLVLRVEDFVEWVRGGLMNDDDEEEDDDVEEVPVKREYGDKSAVRAEEEQRRREADRRRRLVADEELCAESVPLAAAKIVERIAVNGADRLATIKAAAAADDDRPREDGCERSAAKTKKTTILGDTQRLVVMSYSRYCRYRAQLQRRLEQPPPLCPGGEQPSADRANAVRVLFCRDTYDYPAELLMQPFNSPHGRQRHSPVLVNHMAPKLKGWPAYPASWMSFRWNRVRRRLRHMERGNCSKEEQQRRHRRRKLKKKCRRGQNGNSATGASLGYLSSSDNGNSDDTDTDGSSASNDEVTNTTTSDSDGTPPTLAVTAKTASKNQTPKENGSGHCNKKTLTELTAGNSFVINGTTVSTVAMNKRPAVVGGQSDQQQSSKRRRFVYPVTANQPPLQQGMCQQLVFNPRLQLPQQQQLYQQFNQLTQLQRQHLIVAQQQHQQRQLLDRRLPAPVTSLQPSSTRLVHQHLPPSVSIVPVIVSDPKNFNVLQQQQQRSNSKQLQAIRPKPLANVSITQRPNINSSRPLTIEYGKNQKFDNNLHKRTTTAAAIAACHRRARYVEASGDLPQQQEDEDRQRRWLVDALRLGGLEVTAVPAKVSSFGSNKNDGDSSRALAPVETVGQSKRERSRGNNEHPNGATGTVQSEKHQDGSYDDSDTDSVMMTVTPDVVCLLNKSQKHQQSQAQTAPVSSSTPSTPTLRQLRPSVTLEAVSSSSGSNSGGSSRNTTGAEPPLHDKITRAIDALKKQQKQLLNTSNNLPATNASGMLQDNSVSDSKSLEPRQRKIGLAGPPPRLIKTKEGYLFQNHVKLPVKPPSTATAAYGAGPPRLLSAVKINAQQHQPKLKRDSACPTKKLEISILPAATSTVTNVTQFKLSQQQQKSCKSAETRSAHIGMSEASLSMAIRQQLQRRIATGSLTVPTLPPAVDNRVMSVTTSEPTLQRLMQHQLIAMGTAAQSKQLLTDKINLQPMKKD